MRCPSVLTYENISKFPFLSASTSESFIPSFRFQPPEYHNRSTRTKRETSKCLGHNPLRRSSTPRFGEVVCRWSYGSFRIFRYKMSTLTCALCSPPFTRTFFIVRSSSTQDFISYPLVINVWFFEKERSRACDYVRNKEEVFGENYLVIMKSCKYG